MTNLDLDRDDDDAIAVIGMAGRFPQAPDVGTFWAACRDGADCITRWSGQQDEGRVLAGGLVADQALFDADAFGVSPAEAEILDPQHRVFLELCWHGLEEAAVVPDKETLISVYAAAAPSRYRPAGAENHSENSRYQRMIANGADYLATRISYHLDLRGEAVNVQTACSSSLIAVHLACLSLQSRRSDVALAGGVSIDPDQENGYVYEAGMITSPDGVCLPFDADARGAVPGNGGGVVVLQRLSDALAQGRPVHAVIRATAVNNDGRGKSSFMAPNVEGQSEVIAAALATAGVPAETIEYFEAHGTATSLGDSIEFEAARTAFRYFTDRREFCALGSLKANFGHLDRSAGVAGLIKAVHAVREGVIPPLLGFRRPNSDFDLAASPFRIPTTAEPWRSAWPRRAGVSSFGVGGTNAHVIVEELAGPRRNASPAAPGRPIVLPLSAHNENALAQIGRDLVAKFDSAPLSLDAVHTLAAGRVGRPVRAFVVTSPDAANNALRALQPAAATPAASGSLAVLFPGQGAEVGYDGWRLAARYKIFDDEIRAFADALDVSPEQLLHGVSGSEPAFREFAHQPALVAAQIALARLAEDFGIIGAAFCGNSLGEYAAAYMAGVFDRRSLMTILAVRDREMRAAPEGRMMAVLLGAQEVEPLLLDHVDIAGRSWRDRVVLSGPQAAIQRQLEILEGQGVLARILPGRVAPHGRLMANAGDNLRRAFEGVALASPTRPMVSTLLGTWASADQLTDPEHWVRHLCEPFQFEQAFETLAESGFDRFVEASPGGALTKLVRSSNPSAVCSTVGGEPDADPEASLLTALGELWCSGAKVAWDAVNDSGGAGFTVLPPYPFQRRRYWSHGGGRGGQPSQASRQDGLLERLVWRPQPGGGMGVQRALPRQVGVHGDGPVAGSLIEQLKACGVRIIGSDEEAAPGISSDTVLVDLSQAGPRSDFDEPTTSERLEAWLFSSFLGPVEPLERLRPAKLLLVVRGLAQIANDDRPTTVGAGAVGVAKCAPHDWPGLQARIVDLPQNSDPVCDAEAIISELASVEDHDVAYRNGVRYRLAYEPVSPSLLSPLRSGGTYVVLGGSGRLGAVVAEAVSREVKATIVLVGRSLDRTAPGETEALIAVASARGCTVQRLAARSDDRAQLRGLLDNLTARTGRVDGIFHLAANTDIASFALLGETSMETATAITQAKVCTAALLAEEMAGRDYDFVALYSSISTVIGARRFGAYAAANAYLDALAVKMRTKTGQAWCSLVWDGWAPDGAAAANALGFDNGAALLLRALRTDSAVVAPVTQPLEERLAVVRANLEVIARAGLDAAPIAQDLSIAERVLRVVTDVTGHREIDLEQNLAALGIDSLRLMQIAVRLQAIVGKSVGIGKFLVAASVRELTTLAAAESAERTDQAAPLADDRALSTPQQRLWYLAQLNPESADYNVPFGWLTPPGARVREAVLSMLERHELLRSAYREEIGGQPYRATIPAQDVPITEIELDPADPDGSFERTVREAVEAPFNLPDGSTRVLIGFSAESARLVFVCHHISIDAWSIKILGKELALLLSGDGHTIAEPPARYGDFVRWEQDARTWPEYDRLAGYWRDSLRDARPTLPPPDDGMLPASERPVGRATAVLPREQLEQLQAIFREKGATLYAAAVTGLSVALSQWVGRREIVIGANLANRMREDFEAVVGMFVDPVVLRMVVGPNDATTLGAALENVRKSLTAALTHTGIPYLDVVRLSGRRDAEGDNPLFSIIATMFDVGEGRGHIPSLDVPLPPTSKFALGIEFLPRRDGLLIHVLYAADRYRPATIERLMATMLQYLTALSTGGADMTMSSLFKGAAATAAREKFARRFSSDVPERSSNQ